MKKKNRKNQITKQNNRPKLEKGSRKAWILLALILWSSLCVAFYYLSIKENLLWVIHLYVWISLPCLCGAVFINAYCNAKYTSPDEKESLKKPDERFIKKMRNIIKALILIGFPPLACVLIEYIAARLLEKF